MRTLRGFAQIVILLSAQTATPWLSQKAVGAEAKIQTEQKTVPTIQELEQGIANRLQKVGEFRFIQEEAQKLGVRAYLFGGTAAGYAHYVKWDLQREKGDSRFQKDRFDYDYTNIYRSTQDLDIVIDGNPDQANKLQQALQQKYPHLQGGKTAWEVRLLTQDMGDKQAILNNPDFMNQHTDSNSTGMIEITKPKNGEHVVRDVRDWNSKEPYFLKDVHDGMLHYYFSPLHNTTKFAKEGRNPPIISAIRFLTKAFQYELKIRPEDLAKIKKIIQEFDPRQTAKNDYVAKWIEKNGKKLIQNAVNIEYAKNTLDQLGLREKLQSIKGDIDHTDTLAWWMNKEPLRTYPIGQGTGKTAKELGLDIVAHETNNFLAYESITRAHTGDPNVLISRAQVEGEAAIFGNGFYTKVGTEGARGTGLTIRFHLDPNAREGHDFAFVPGEHYVVIKNKAALKVIPESLNIGPVEYFKLLADNSGTGLQQSDRGILEKLKRRIGAKAQTLTDKDKETISHIVQLKIQSSPELQFEGLLSEWFSLPTSQNHPEIIDAILQNGSIDRNVANWVLPRQKQVRPNWIEKLLSNGQTDRQLATHYMSQPQWANPSWVERLIQNGKADEELVLYVFSQPQWAKHPELLEKLIDKGTVDSEIIQHVLSKPQWVEHPRLVSKLLAKRSNDDSDILAYILTQHHWKDHPEFVETILNKGMNDFGLAHWVLRSPHWKDHPEWIERLIKKGTVDGNLASVLSKPHWSGHPKLRRLVGGRVPTVENLREAFTQGKTLLAVPKNQEFEDPSLKWIKSRLQDPKNFPNQGELSKWFSLPISNEHPEIVDAILKQGTLDQYVIRNVLTQPQWKNHPEWVEILISQEMNHSSIAKWVLSKPHWKDHPELVEKLLYSGYCDTDLAIYAFSQPHWKDHPEWIKRLIKKGTQDGNVAFLLRETHWKNHPELRRLAAGQDPTVENLRAAFARGETLHVMPKTCVLNHLNGTLH
jgi:hypothetical protein